ncbi:hypothetical protein [Metabacillus niabensis]|nr:hypothetical protein [Metabacillus niabensis]
MKDKTKQQKRRKVLHPLDERQNQTAKEKKVLHLLDERQNHPTNP